MNLRNKTPSDEFYRELIEFLSVYRVLIDEKNYYDNLLNKGFNIYTCLAYTRAHFSHVESVNYCLKYFAFRASEHFELELSRGEISALLEEKYNISKSGKVRTSDSYFSPSENTKFISRLYVEYFELDHKIDFHSKGWQNFKKALSIRNRITHPKSSFDIDINNSDMVVVKSSINWYTEFVRNILSTSIRKMLYKVQFDRKSEVGVDDLIDRILE